MYREIKRILFKTDKLCSAFFWIFGLLPILMMSYLEKVYGGISISLIIIFLCCNSAFVYLIIFMLKRVEDRLKIFYYCGSSKMQIGKEIAVIMMVQYMKMIVIGIVFYVGVF